MAHPEPRNGDRRNDTALLTPILIMALIVAAGFLVMALGGHAAITAG